MSKSSVQNQPDQPQGGTVAHTNVLMYGSRTPDLLKLQTIFLLFLWSLENLKVY